MRKALVFSLGSLLAATPVFASPRHDVCPDLGSNFGFGVSSYSEADDWPTAAHTTYGVDWRFLYIYVVPTSNPPSDDAAFWVMKDGIATSLGANMVFTFYELLAIGTQAGVTGASEANIVQQVLANPTLMATYFDNFVFLLQTAATLPPPVFVQVEPDSWGFMMWSMGIDGNTDPAAIPVQVAGSGRAELASFTNDASGFAHALLALRDTYAPAVRMGWHASNFREGTRPEVVTGFYAGMGDWDVIFTEHPHNEADDGTWWLPWDPTMLDDNLDWFHTVSSTAHLPILIWQAPIGTTDWHLLGNSNDLTTLALYANAGVSGLMFELLDTATDVDDFRASGMFGSLGTVPPASSGADGTAAGMRTRLVAYDAAPLVWPVGSICARASTPDAGIDGGESDGSVVSDGFGGDAHADASGRGDIGGATASGCGCAIPGRARDGAAGAVLLGLVTLARRRRRARE